MFRKIYKIVFLLLFLFPSIFSMNYNPQDHGAAQVQMQMPQVTIATNQGLTAGNSGVVVTQKNGQTQCYISMNSIPTALVAAFQVQLPSEMIAGRNIEQDVQSDQHMGKILTESIEQSLMDTVSAAKQVEVSSYLEQIPTMVRNEVSEYMKSLASCSNYEHQVAKSKLFHDLPQLKMEYQTLIEKNGHLKGIVDPGIYGLTPRATLNQLTWQDLRTVKEILVLQKKIEVKESCIQEIDNKLKQEECNQVKQFESKSIEMLQKETIPALAEQERLNQAKVTEEETNLHDVWQELKENKAEQARIDQRFFLVKMKDAFKGDHRRSDLVNVQKILEATCKTCKEKLPSLEFKLNESKKQLACAQKILNEKLAQEERNKEMQLAQEQYRAQLAQEQTQSQYESLELDCKHCPDYVCCDRQQALTKTHQDGYGSYNQEYHLSPRATEFLEKHGLDHSLVHNFSGTALQHQLHGEYCNIVEQAAEKQAQLFYQSDMLKQCVLCADAAHQANQLGQIQTVLSLNNLSFTLLEYAQAINAGVAQGLKAVGHSIMHPVQTVESVAKAAYYVLETAALNQYSEVYGFQDLCIPLRDQRNAEIIAGLQNLGHAIENSTGPQRVQAMTQFAVEFGVSGKIMNAVGGAMGIAQSAVTQGVSALQAQTEVPIMKQVVASMLKETKGLKSIVPDVAKTAQKAEAVAQEKIAQNVAENLMNAEKQLDRAGKAVGHGCEKINEFQKTLADLLKNTTPGRATSGRARQYEKLCSDYNEAIKDFHNLKPNNIKDLPNKEGLRGILADGRTINVRMDSQDGRPTIEIMKPDCSGMRIKVRYGAKNT